MKKKINLVLQALLGLALLVFGLNKFFFFLPMPEELPEGVQKFFEGASATGYLMPLVGLTEAVVGALLLLRLWSALALVLLAPISVNIVLFHWNLDPAGIGLAIFVAGLNLYLLFTYLPKYRPLLAMK